MTKYCWQIEKVLETSWRKSLPKGNGRWRMKRKAKRLQAWSDSDRLIMRVVEKVEKNEV